MSEALSRAELWEQYDRSLTEYRFQVELNWKRTQYFFALNVAVLAAGTGLLSAATDARPAVIVALFVVGVALALFAVLAGRIQKGYYDQARDLVKSIQEELPLENLAIRTTPGLGSGRSRWKRVGTLQEWMFGLIAILDVAGLVAAVA